MNQNQETVVVIGGGRGIGAATAKLFAHRGWAVWIGDSDRLQNKFNHYRSTEVAGFKAASELASNLRSEGADCWPIAVDACSEESVTTMFETVQKASHRINAVVNAFGITWVSSFEAMTLEMFESVVHGNLNGTFLSCRAAMPYLRETCGAIVNIASVAGQLGFAKVSAYSAAKFAIVGLTSSLAKEVAASGVRVNALCPGIIRTNMWEYLLDEFQRKGETREQCWSRMEAMIPQGKAQTAEDIAQAAWFLSTNPGITGQTLTIDGGMNPAP